MARCHVRTLNPIDSGVSIRPAAEADAERLRRFLAGLSTRTAYQRFFSGLGPVSNAMLARLLPHGRQQDTVVAVHGDEIVAHAMCARMPGQDDIAELAVVVADAWQQRGLGPRLVGSVLAAAQGHGVRTVEFTVLADNRPANRLAKRSWPQARPVVGQGVYQYLVGLTEPDAA
jgi:RimJ/RimL family protein N-acetyltransferase